MTALNEDRKLLGLFLRKLVKVEAPADPRKLLVLEQQYPGEEEASEDDPERRGIPDGWIFDEEGWCVFIETKVIAKLDADQINRHRRTAERRGFQSVTAVAITPVVPPSLPAGVVLLEWREVYAWLRRYSPDSIRADRAADYLEIAEAKLIDTQQFVAGTLTMFSGFPFGRDHPFTYLEGKRVLKLAMSELRGRTDLRSELGVNREAPGRPAITQGDGLWDFLSLSEAKTGEPFTKYLHLTFGLGSQSIAATVTVPNAVNASARRKIVELGEKEFQELIKKVVANLKSLLRDHPGAKPWFRGGQQRWTSIKAKPIP